MEISKDELQELVGRFGQIMHLRQAELDIAEDVADSDLTVAQEATTAEINGFKALVAAKMKQAGVGMPKESDTLEPGPNDVIIPDSISCTC